MKTKELITPEMLWTVILNTYMDSINELRSNLSNHDEYDNLVRLKKELLDSGLSGTENYRIVLQKLEKVKKTYNNEEAFKFLTQLKHIYPDSIVLPYRELYKILDKYNLEMAPINYYKNIIPSENIEEMIEVNKTYKNYNIPPVSLNHIDSVTITSDIDCSEIVKLFSRIPYILENQTTTFRINENISGSLANHITLDVIPSDKYSYDKDSWTIIAPSDDIKEQCIINVETYKEREARYRVQDPLVGKFCKYGFIIFSKWGEEADIQELNNWISKKWQSE